MKKALAWILILFSIVIILIRFSSKIEESVFGIRPKTGISILSVPDSATVFMDNQEVGKTPYDNNDLEVKEYNVKLDRDGVFWQGKVKLSAGTVTIINRDLASDQASSSGEILSLDRGRGMTVISNPS
ncbi:PEGA domain-containing protein, partial [Candidatus Daviesbacteria bacterium]|nr:PEGA domain-containing protein [Candidatus Daviesbacteria bacterium]